MSLIDPSTRWWNRAGARRTAAFVAWSASLAAAAIAGWAVAFAATPTDGGVPEWLLITCCIVPIPLLLLGAFLYFLGDDSGDFEPRSVFMPLAGYFLVFGIGAIGGQISVGAGPSVIWIIFAGVGLIAVFVIESVSRLLSRNRELRDRVERAGVTVSGVVTRAKGYSAGHSPVTRVTVAFTDTAGRHRWAGQTVNGTVQVGERVIVRYLPADVP